MDFLQSFNRKEKPLFIIGLGLSGKSVLEACHRANRPVYIYDDRPEYQILPEYRHYSKVDFKEVSAVVLAAGIPLTHPEPHPVVALAKAENCPILSDVELFWQEIKETDAKIIAITGTNGKSTTTALMTHVLNTLGKTAFEGGNIGVPTFDLPRQKDAIYVLELSSYQLDLCPTLEADISILLNITPDHLDRHGGIEGYCASKKKVFQGAGLAILPSTDKYVQKIKSNIPQRVVLENTETFPSTSRLQGAHNQQNISAVYMACLALIPTLKKDHFIEAIKPFKGLRHRQYQVLDKNNIIYINDSKATNVEASVVALEPYKNIYWIAGGKGKEGADFEIFTPYLSHIKKGFFIGASQDLFFDYCQKHNIPSEKCDILEKALEQAHIEAIKADEKSVILLSPACASFDQFNNFEERGRVFEDYIVKNFN